MSYFNELKYIEHKCRICLSQSAHRISLDEKMDTAADSPSIIEALQTILSSTVNKDSGYPKEICRTCFNSVKISYNLLQLFDKSQNILEKYINLKPLLKDHNFDKTGYENLLLSEINVKYETVETSEDETAEDDDERDSESAEVPVNEYKPGLSKVDGLEGNATIPSEEATDLDIKKEVTIKSEEGTELNGSSDFKDKPFVVSENLFQNTTPDVMNNLSKENSTVTPMKENLVINWINGNTCVIKNRSKSDWPKCRYCNQSFVNKNKLKEHFYVCTKVTNQKCEYCPRKFPTASMKKSHQKIKHSSKIGLEERLYHCDLCSAVFKSSHGRSYHKLTRHNTDGKIYACDVCDKTFFIKNSLDQHMETHNKNVSVVVCPICGKSFHYRGGLFYHMKVHRNERNYVCSFCERRFLNLTSLKRHVRTHTGERPYVCTYCPKTFCSVTEVKTHEKRHTGTKPHHCKYCDKAYMSNYDLKFHMASHPGNQYCHECGKGFLNSEVLKLHGELKHNSSQDAGSQMYTQENNDEEVEEEVDEEEYEEIEYVEQASPLQSE